MKVVFVVTSLPANGAQVMLLKLLEHLDSRFTPHVISLSSAGEIGPRIEALGIPVDALGLRPGLPNPLALMRLVRKIRSLRPDIVQTWMYHGDLLGGVAARMAGVHMIVWSIRNGNLDADKNKYSTLMVVRACAVLSSSIPRKIISNSEFASRLHIAHGYDKSKMVIIPNGFDLSPFHPDPEARTSVRRELGIEDECPVVGWIGRFHPHKNVEGFFEAAAMLHSRMPGVRFVLAGEGIDKSNRAIARSLHDTGVGQAVHLLGVRKDVPRLMAAMDVLASSSTGEAFSNVLGEAMASGVPCTVTDVGDSAYIVADTGRAAPPNDMAKLAGIMGELLALPAEERAALGARARQRVAEHFEIGRIVKQYEQLYDGLAAGIGPLY